jgi:hypothetical protein
MKKEARIRKREKAKNLTLRISHALSAHPFGKGGWKLGSEEDKASSWEIDCLSILQEKKFEGLVLNLKCSPSVHTVNLETESLLLYKRLDQKLK